MYRYRKLLLLTIAGIVWTSATATAARAEMLFSLVATSPTLVAPHESVYFNVILSGLDELAPSESLFSFSLNFGASSSPLTDSGTNFGRFAFILNPALAGGLAFDDDVSDDGHVEYEIGFLPADPSLLLGSLLVEAPALPGTHGVEFQRSPSDPFGAGTFLLIDDGSSLGLVAPGDRPLTTVGEQFTITSTSPVPEPTSLVLLGSGVLTFLGIRRWNRLGI